MIGAIPRLGAARITVVLLAFASCAQAPASALAARPGTLIAPGEAPSVAVDATGTGYVVWNDKPPGQDDEPVGLCVIGKGASHCSSSRDVIADGESGEAQPALISATGVGQLVIASGRCCLGGNVEVVSTNGGAAFGAAVSVGGITYFDGAIGPEGQALFVHDNIIDGVFSQVGSIAGPASNSATLFDPPPGTNAIGGWAGNTPVVVATGSETEAAIYSGTGDVNDGASWNNVRVPGSTYNPSMASGPAGLFLLQDTGPSQRRLTVRRFRGNGFGPAHVIAITRGTSRTALTEAPSGHLLAAWYDNGTIFASASRGGVHWTRARAIATDVETPGRIDAALGPGGRGWLVYELEFGSEVRVVGINADALLGVKPHPKPKPKPKPHRHHKPRHPPAKQHLAS